MISLSSPAGCGDNGGNHAHPEKRTVCTDRGPHRASCRGTVPLHGFRGDSAWTNTPCRRGEVHFCCSRSPIPRLVVVSARNASKMRKSPQSKKPLHNVFSAPPLCLAGAAWAERVEMNLTVLRDVRKMPPRQRPDPRGAGHKMRFFSSALIVTGMTRGTGSRLS
jgi:hypothetical protein